MCCHKRTKDMLSKKCTTSTYHIMFLQDELDHINRCLLVFNDWLDAWKTSLRLKFIGNGKKAIDYREKIKEKD